MGFKEQEIRNFYKETKNTGIATDWVPYQHFQPKVTSSM